MLRRVRRALADVPAAERPEDVTVPRTYARAGGPAPGAPETVRLFAERVADYRAAVRVIPVADAASAVAAALTARGAERVVVPDGFPADWLAALAPEQTVLRDDPPLPLAALDGADGVLTTVAAAIAETGTFVLDAGTGQGRRALTLVPDYHLCVVRAAQVVLSVPEALALLDPGRPLTFVSGPSATSDIELDRIEGVHGPRTLEVLVVT
ncbi:lactate utilization protein C [Streptomyces armeniacus]|uniref:Lactate utilization protein C n=1 Tax=Streptomyces armeniacus TaxID=83291 RepID=A0A345Y1R0_9ACTN|nr:LUD domain-containing protein [Streptomyces armeniacus]AXK37826.1 lactate utilization protein C [Streptomyces armeniacus]